MEKYILVHVRAPARLTLLDMLYTLSLVLSRRRACKHASAAAILLSWSFRSSFRLSCTSCLLPLVACKSVLTS